VQVAELAGVSMHALQARDRVVADFQRRPRGSRPPRPPPLQLDVVDLDHDAVISKFELAAARLPVAAA